MAAICQPKRDKQKNGTASAVPFWRFAGGSASAALHSRRRSRSLPASMHTDGETMIENPGQRRGGFAGHLFRQVLAYLLGAPAVEQAPGPRKGRHNAHPPG